MTRTTTILLALLLQRYVTLLSAKVYTKHRVTKLPGLNEREDLSSSHWTGFVETDESSETRLFYYFAEQVTENVVIDDTKPTPLILWMNGGPGASSLAGFFGENGPYILTEENKLMKNPFAWNRLGHLLAVEFAPGIGFSYCANSTKENGTDFCNGDARWKDGACSPCYASDTSVARQNAELLETFVSEIFPELLGKNVPVYIAGESYAGVYGPTLGLELLKRGIVSLRGLWITDPCTDNEAQFGRLDMGLDFSFEKGLLSKNTYEVLREENGACSTGRTLVGDFVRNTNTSTCREAWRVYDLATAGIGNSVHPSAINGLPLYIDPLNALGVAGGGGDVQGYLGSAEVRDALGVSSTLPYFLEIGNNGYPQYDLQFAACNNDAKSGADSMVQIWRDIVTEHRRSSSSDSLELLVLNGDLDGIVGLHGTESAVQKIDYKSTNARRPWFYNATATPPETLLEKPLPWGPSLRNKNAGPQIGGFVTNYETGQDDVRLRFVTVRAAGHMTPR